MSAEEDIEKLAEKVLTAIDKLANYPAPFGIKRDAVKSQSEGTMLEEFLSWFGIDES